jgi:hypothetical protein
MPDEQFQSCIEACNECAVACERCAAACLAEEPMLRSVRRSTATAVEGS